MRAVGGYRRFGGHAGVRQRMCAGARCQVVALGDEVWVAHGFEHLDLVALGQHGRACHVVDDPLAGATAVAVGGEHRVVMHRRDGHLCAQGRLEGRGHRPPVHLEPFGQHGDAGAARDAGVVHGEPGAVGSAVAHLGEHDLSQPSQFVPVRFGLAEQAHNPAHGAPPAPRSLRLSVGPSAP